MTREVTPPSSGLAPMVVIHSKVIFNGKRNKEAPGCRFKPTSFSTAGKEEVDPNEGKRRGFGERAQELF